MGSCKNKMIKSVLLLVLMGICCTLDAIVGVRDGTDDDDEEDDDFGNAMQPNLP